MELNEWLDDVDSCICEFIDILDTFLIECAERDAEVFALLEIMRNNTRLAEELLQEIQREYNFI